MKERPILFSAAMVRAILAGKKTQTRRIVKPQPSNVCTDYWRVVASTRRSMIDTWIPRGGVPNEFGEFPKRGKHVRCPYGVPGDRLWVRECWGLFDTQPSDGPDRAHVFYRATDGNRRELRYQLWRSSIHMPRWASRITLEVVAVRVERLQDISNNDAIAEGCNGERWLDPDGSEGRGVEPWEQFRELWESINGTESWSANPWVWVVEFKRLEA